MPLASAVTPRTASSWNRVKAANARMSATMTLKHRASRMPMRRFMKKEVMVGLGAREVAVGSPLLSAVSCSA